MKLERIRAYVTVGVMAALLLGLSVWCWLKPADDYSESERRVLAAFPKVSVESVLSGEFTKDFETYTQDQFPMRDQMRRVKAIANLFVFQQKDNNDLYLADGYVSKLDYPLRDSMVNHALERFRYLTEHYLEPNGSKVYLAVIPDKNYYLAQPNGYPTMDYEALFERLRQECGDMAYIDLTEQLSIEDYYHTDTHWRQENLLPVARYLAGEMGVSLSGEGYTVNTVDHPFWGVYVGQSALPLTPDTLHYLTSPALEDCVVTGYATGTGVEIPMYDLKKSVGRDPYEMFTGGSNPLVTIENPNAASDRELIIFRDSFAGSLAPLLAEGYRKITLVDIRYVRSEQLGQLVDFHGQDALFLYSTLLLNSSTGLK